MTLLYLFCNKWYGFNSIVDINECADENGGCEQLCSNTDGSYQCRCKLGYKLKNDKHYCNGKPQCNKLAKKDAKLEYCYNIKVTFPAVDILQPKRYSCKNTV